MRDGSCNHIYEVQNKSTCDLCNKSIHDIDWQVQNALREQWLVDNPDAKYQGWMSI